GTNTSRCRWFSIRKSHRSADEARSPLLVNDRGVRHTGFERLPASGRSQANYTLNTYERINYTLYRNTRITMGVWDSYQRVTNLLADSETRGRSPRSRSRLQPAAAQNAICCSALGRQSYRGETSQPDRHGVGVGNPGRLFEGRQPDDADVREA